MNNQKWGLIRVEGGGYALAIYPIEFPLFGVRGFNHRLVFSYYPNCMLFFFDACSNRVLKSSYHRESKERKHTIMSSIVEDRDRKMEKQLDVTTFAQGSIEGQSTFIDAVAEKSSRMYTTRLSWCPVFFRNSSGSQFANSTCISCHFFR